MQYKNLKTEMTRNGISISKISELLGVRYATANDKVNGKSRFTTDEAIKIKRVFFNDQDLEYLFYRDLIAHDSKIAN